MPTVHEILKSSGFTDAQIAGLDGGAIKAFEGVLTSAENEKKSALADIAKAEEEKKAAAAQYVKAQADLEAAKKAQEAAEIAQRSNVEFYETKITPALAGWDEAKKQLEVARGNAEAEAAYWKKQIETAKTAGYLPVEPPAFVIPNTPDPARDPQGRFVANQPGSTPGSPTFVDATQIAARAADGMNLLTDIQWEYQTLFGKPMPISPSQLVAQADQVKLDPKTFAARHFNFDQRRQEIAQQAEQAKNAEITAAAVKPLQEQLAAKEKEYDEKLKTKEREWAEKHGSNPDVRIPEASRFPELQRAVKANERPDPLALNTEQRAQATRSAIRQEITQNAVQ